MGKWGCRWGKWGERGKGKKFFFFFWVLHIAAFFEKCSYRSPLKNCLVEPIVAFFKNVAIGPPSKKLFGWTYSRISKTQL